MIARRSTMTTPYPIVPLEWLDDLDNLNGALDTYQRLVTTWIDAIDTNGTPTEIGPFVAGLDMMFKPIMEGYRDVQSQIQQAREMRLVGVASIADPGEDHANR
jgi:hypothetical protein